MRLTGRVVTPSGVIEDGYVDIDGGLIAEVGDAAHGEPQMGGDPHGEPQRGERQWIVPGFVDMHNHGGGGHTFTTGDADSARAAAAFHLRHGTTTVLASLVSAPFPLMRAATAGYAPLVAEGVIAGVHYEGPYLSEPRCGAQNPAHLRDPSLAELAELIDLGAGVVRMVTLAPERRGALDAIGLLVDRGVIAAVGHTDASYEQTMAAVAAGATVGTHLFNGMPAPHHRTPGPVFALLGAAGVTCELIPDGVHLHDGTLAFAAFAAGPDRAALITDAMAAAGMPDGAYELGGQEVVVADRVARLARDGSIAGSTLTMDAGLRRAVHAGLSIVAACRAAALVPARALGLTDRGAVAPGHRADLVLLNPDLTVARVMRDGRWA
ncbi:N-acetylglucosamine-6-phosphate deacetylase [Rhizomonospora bruguierae]|uniref:N-acetylglucosamine-6-phosphate deacetylase n=1 Tax=Rhizomonospora bruguierae TaxID=1581705 RepID=UPI001BD0FF49|nr:N-acetylglucosamine-6-phosphate deacetylase [Micromonospora sp. NBRC 107566]